MNRRASADTHLSIGYYSPSWPIGASPNGVLNYVGFLSQPCHPPWPLTALALAVVGFSRERPGHLDRVRLRCPKSFAPSDYSGRTSWWGTSGRTLGYVLVVGQS